MVSTDWTVGYVVQYSRALSPKFDDCHFETADFSSVGMRGIESDNTLR